ncbi:MAG TPA: hypothetical protein V6D50_09855 [Chroococcales cyanobacterium]
MTSGNNFAIYDANGSHKSDRYLKERSGLKYIRLNKSNEKSIVSVGSSVCELECFQRKKFKSKASPRNATGENYLLGGLTCALLLVSLCSREVFSVQTRSSIRRVVVSIIVSAATQTQAEFSLY